MIVANVGANQRQLVRTCPFTVPSRGFRVLWEISLNCNLRCKHCFVYDDHVKHTGNKTLSLDECKAIVDKMRAAGVTEVWLSGGEPLMHKNILDVIEYLNVNDIRPSLSTNGVLLTESKVASLDRHGVRYIHVSIDGVDADIHDEVRGVRGSFDRLMANLDILKRYPRIQVGVTFVLNRLNASRIVDFLELSLQRGIGRVSFYPIVPMANETIDETLLLSKESLIEIQNQLAVYQERYADRTLIELIRMESDASLRPLQPCHGEKFLSLNSKGELGPCPWYNQTPAGFTVGNVLDNDMLPLISDVAARFQEAMRERRKSLPKCGSCEVNMTCGGGCPAASPGYDPLCNNGDLSLV